MLQMNSVKINNDGIPFHLGIQMHAVIHDVYISIGYKLN